MRHKFIAAFSLLVMSVLLSCTDEWTRFELAELNAIGIELKKKDVLSYYGEIPASGGEITLTATGKHQDAGYLSDVVVQEFYLALSGAERHEPFPTTVCEEAWGKVEILSVSPHTTRITFSPNATGNSIPYKFFFGGAYVVSEVYITQLPE